jgi:predicted Zn finger-like uncharacterized protein
MPAVECPNCTAKLNASAKVDGHTVRCPQCGEVFVLRFQVRSDPVIELYGHRPGTRYSSGETALASYASEASPHQ